ncbi:hypothetical protein L1049_012053 [Liquidambar formosana]|uniref:Uncharacterized protein n=1 Tax=Liquidambar formosana TaxID=63359 RepID=A0AAP0RTJ1_LIQFO
MKFSFSCSTCFSPSTKVVNGKRGGVEALQNLHAFSYNELKVATNGFGSSNKIGKGGFGSVYKAWEMYTGNKLEQLVDPMLYGNFPKIEAVRFLKVGLLCVQETSGLRPHMSTAIKMMGDEINMDDVQISQPGLLTCIMDVKIDQPSSSQSIVLYPSLFK